MPADAHLTGDTEALFYRVAQEAVRNSRTHSDASEVWIALVLGSNDMRFVIEDTGRGFAQISETVKAHLTSVFSQLGVTDRTQAALWAQRHLHPD